MATTTGDYNVFFKEGNVVRVTDNWQAKTGAELIENLKLGKVLGAGMQGQIFELTDSQGRIAPIVMKATKPGGLISEIEREWDAGQKLASLADRDGTLRGFMKVGPAVRNSKKMIGQILERINGPSVSKVIGNKDFHDVHYIRALLQEVFITLDRAQREFGFHHYDLRLDNVMEHVPLAEQDASDEISNSMFASTGQRNMHRQFKVIDYGLTKFDDHYSHAHGWLAEQLIELKRIQSSASSGGSDENGEVKKKRKQKFTTAAPEWIHTTAWKGKGDVYHLLFDLSQFIHARVWPREDTMWVELLGALISHATGVQPKAWYEAAKDEDESAFPVVSQSKKYGIPERRRDGVRGCLQSYQSWSYIVRWGRKLKAWHYPSNPGLTAGEALQAAFFDPALWRHFQESMYIRRDSAIDVATVSEAPGTAPTLSA